MSTYPSMLVKIHICQHKLLLYVILYSVTAPLVSENHWLYHNQETLSAVQKTHRYVSVEASSGLRVT